MSSLYDVLVIGAGPAGYVAAIRAAQLGLKTAIVERRWLGGVCLNVGCIPSKALLRNAEVVALLRQRAPELGLAVEGWQADYSVAVRRSRQVAERLVKGVSFLLRKNTVAVYEGEATIIAPQTVRVRTAQGEALELRAHHLVIATGARAVVPASWPADGRRVLTYLEAIVQERLPRSVVIVGGGAIGVEFATLWNAYGSEVTLVEMLPHLLPLEDEEAAIELERSFRKRGIRVLTGHRVTALETQADGVQLTLSSNDATLTVEAEQVLLAMGFQPNSRNLGLEEIGVQLDERGFVMVDEHMATNVPGVWAIGDVTGKLMLAHVGSAQGLLCAESIAGLNPPPLHYEHMPRAVYSQPQVAAFGLTEAQARERGLAVRVARFPFQANGKALALGEYGGWVKLIVEEGTQRLLGAHLVGPEVTELLPELTLTAHAGLTVEHIARNVHAHPTLNEVLMEAAHAALGGAIHL